MKIRESCTHYSSRNGIQCQRSCRQSLSSECLESPFSFLALLWLSSMDKYRRLPSPNTILMNPARLFSTNHTPLEIQWTMLIQLRADRYDGTSYLPLLRVRKFLLESSVCVHVIMGKKPLREIKEFHAIIGDWNLSVRCDQVLWSHREEWWPLWLAVTLFRKKANKKRILHG